MKLTIQARLQAEPPLLLDGATGTELTRRGIETPIPLWSAAALNTNPEAVYAIHRDYLTAGADIITTNTFRTHARNIGSSSEAKRLTMLAVELAQQAAQESPHPAWVAGSVAPLEDCYSPHLTPDAATCQRQHREIIENLAQAGVDFCLIETMNTLHEAQAAAEAAQAVGIPFMMSFILNEDLNLLSGESLAQAVAAITPLAFLINCIPTRHMTAALHKLRGLTDLPIGGYGNMGTPESVMGWAFEGELAPQTYCDHATEWLAVGAKLIGSCCGSSPAHTAALRKLIQREQTPN